MNYGNAEQFETIVILCLYKGNRSKVFITHLSEVLMLIKFLLCSIFLQARHSIFNTAPPLHNYFTVVFVLDLFQRVAPRSQQETHEVILWILVLKIKWVKKAAFFQGF